MRRKANIANITKRSDAANLSAPIYFALNNASTACSSFTRISCFP